MATAALDRALFPSAWFERHLGWKSEAAAIALLTLTVGSLLANLALTSATTPAAYAERYLSAQAAGDAPGVWGGLQVGALPAADASLLGEPALAAMLRLPANRTAASGMTGETFSITQRSAKVAVTYRDGAATRKVEVDLVRNPSERQWLLYPRWRVAIMPAVLELQSATGGAEVTVDGLPIPASAKTVAVFPGTHQVALAASHLLQADVETVAAAAGPVPVMFRAALTQEAQSQAADAVRAALTACAKATTLVPPKCPQSVIDNINGGATWELFGDPMADATFARSDPSGVVVDGHYEMAVTYQGEYPDIRRHRAIAGVYEASLAWEGTTFTVKDIGQPSTPVAEIPRPAVDDATVLGVVRAAFDRCASATTITPQDCPQSVGAFGQVANVAWHVDRDPVASANVSFNGAQGMFRVAGTYSMTATYDETYQYQPTFHRSTQDAGRYTADLFWDGQKPVFVTFE